MSYRIIQQVMKNANQVEIHKSKLLYFHQYSQNENNEIKTFVIYLKLIFIKQELNELSNIWSQSIKWIIDFRVKRNEIQFIIYLFINSYYPRGYMRVSIYIFIFYLCSWFCSSLADCHSFFYSFFLHYLMILVYLLSWYIPAYILSSLCLSEVLTLAFSLFQSPFWVSFFVIWIYSILRDNAPLSLFHIHIGNTMYSWYRSDRDNDSIHNDLFVVMRFLPPSFNLWFHYTMLNQFSYVFLL